MSDVGEVKRQVLSGIQDLVADEKPRGVLNLIEPQSGVVSPLLDLRHIAANLRSHGPLLSEAKRVLEGAGELASRLTAGIDDAHQKFAGIETDDPRMVRAVEILGIHGSEGEAALPPKVVCAEDMLEEVIRAHTSYRQAMSRYLGTLGVITTEGNGLVWSALASVQGVEQAIELARDYQEGL